MHGFYILYQNGSGRLPSGSVWSPVRTDELSEGAAAMIPVPCPAWKQCVDCGKLASKPDQSCFCLASFAEPVVCFLALAVCV